MPNCNGKTLGSPMASSLNLSLTDELREFIDSRTGDHGVYATPSEYVRDLIRRDMEAQGTVAHVIGGLDNIKHGRFSDKSILDIADEKDV
jgi:antitoxin ParD1/3/4